MKTLASPLAPPPANDDTRQPGGALPCSPYLRRADAIGGLAAALRGVPRLSEAAARHAAYRRAGHVAETIAAYDQEAVFVEATRRGLFPQRGSFMARLRQLVRDIAEG